MTAETVISLIILLVGIVPVIILGIVQYRNENPVGFWTGKEPPEKEQITDIRAYNRKHGLMWILYGIGCILCFACGIPFGKWMGAYLCIFEVTGGIFGMIAYHNRLNRIYCKAEIKNGCK